MNGSAAFEIWFLQICSSLTDEPLNIFFVAQFARLVEGCQSITLTQVDNFGDIEAHAFDHVRELRARAHQFNKEGRF